MVMTTERKGIWNNKPVTIIREEHKSSFGDLLKIRLETGEEKIVNSLYIKNIK